MVRARDPKHRSRKLLLLPAPVRRGRACPLPKCATMQRDVTMDAAASSKFEIINSFPDSRISKAKPAVGIATGGIER